jgi:hypothetical protein
MRPCGSTDRTHCYANNRYAIAMAYVPWQKFGSTYEPKQALYSGTIFPELNLPFGGGRRMPV